MEIKFKVSVVNSEEDSKGERRGVWLDLPMSEEDIEKELNKYGMINDYDSYRVLGYDVPKYLNLNNENCIEDLNELAYKLKKLNEHNHKKFLGLLEDANYEDDYLSLVDDLDNFILIEDIHNDEQLGHYLQEQGIFTISDELEQYIDYELMGKDYFEDSYMGLTSYGLIKEI